jgi:hypothetical protein
MSSVTNLPVPITPSAATRLIPMPVFYDNPPLSLLSVMLFPDDLDLARKAVAHFLSSGTVQSALGSGIQIDNRYMHAIISDLADGQPDQKLVRRRRYWASAVGQVVRATFALINANDPRVRDFASWEQAIRIAEREIGRTVRGKRSSLHVQLARFRPVLHIASAWRATAMSAPAGNRPKKSMTFPRLPGSNGSRDCNRRLRGKVQRRAGAVLIDGVTGNEQTDKRR